MKLFCVQLMFDLIIPLNLRKIGSCESRLESISSSEVFNVKFVLEEIEYHQNQEFKECSDVEDGSDWSNFCEPLCRNKVQDR